jgi:CheY-like chemotaxis protein
VEVISLYDGLETIAWLKALRATDQKPCLIILDINMPRMDGKETLQHIRTMVQFDEVPVMLFTTSTQRFDQDFARRYKAGFLTKPIDDRQMDAIIKNFLAHCAEDVRNEIS